MYLFSSYCLWNKHLENFSDIHSAWCKAIKHKLWKHAANGFMYFKNRWHSIIQRWNRSGFSRPDPIGKFQNHRRSTGRSTGFWPAWSTGFFTENFCSLFNVSYQKFSKGCMGEVLKFVTFRGGLRKKCKKNLRFLQKWLNFKTFFGLVLVWKTCFEQLKTWTK